MEEYTGQFRGGPDDGNLVTASVTTISVVSTLQLWLDGIGEGKTITTIILTGRYVWQENEGFFNWEIDDTHFVSEKMEKVS